MLGPRAVLTSPVRRSISIGLVLVVSLIVGVFTVGRVALADNVDDARRKVEKMADQLEAAEEEVDRLSEELRAAEDDKVRLDGEIAATELEIANKETELGGIRTDMAELAVTAFVSGGRGGSLTGLLAPGGGPNDAVQRQFLTDIALNTGLSDTDKLDSLIADLDDLKSKLERDRKRNEELTNQISKSQTEAQDKIAKYTALKKKAERELGQALRDEQQRRAAQAAANAASQADNMRNNRPTGGNSFDPSSIPSTTSRAGIAVAAAKSQIGVRYRYATAEEGVAFDCSGLTMWAWQQAGVSLPHQSRRQFSSSPRIPKEYAEPGDLIFFYNPITHVGLYVGGGMMVDAPGVGRTVRLTAVNWSKVVGVTRPG